MSHLDQERTCAACSNTFRLAEHGVAGAKAIAQALDAGTLSSEDAPEIVRTCPKCLGTEQIDAAEANAEIFRLEHATTQSRSRQIPRDAKAYASGLAFMGTALFLGSFVFGVMRGHTMLSWSGVAFGGVTAIAGVMIGVVSVSRVYGKRKSQL